MGFKEEILKRRTFGIISHPDAGKTTLTEKLLLFGGAIHVAGAVKSNKIKKTATSDFMEIERQRGISVATSVMGFEYKDVKINILDTPGHQDFAEDTFRVLTACDSVIIVVDSAKGVETQTRKLMQVCRMRKTPVIVFINKLDRPGQDPFDLLDEIEKELQIQVTPLSWPIGNGDQFKGIYNIHRENLCLYSASVQTIQDGIEINDINSGELDEHIGKRSADKLREDLELVREVYPAIARTATNIRAGAMSSISAIVHSLFLVAVVMWLLPLIELIPLAALASVLVIVAYDMSDLRTVRHIFQGPKSDWSVMLLTFALTVVFDLTVAVYTGVILASLLFMRRMGELTGLHSCVSSEDEASGHEIPVPDKNNVPDGVEIFAINGPLFFGVADRFQSTLNAMETPPKVFIMYLHNMSAIDMTGIHALEEFLERRRKGCRVLFAAVRKPVHRTLQRVGILRTVGEENVFPSLDEALLRAEEILEDTIPGERVLPRLVSKS